MYNLLLILRLLCIVMMMHLQLCSQPVANAAAPAFYPQAPTNKVLNTTGQWQQTNGPARGRINNMYADGGRLYISTNCGVYFSGDKAVTWKPSLTGLTLYNPSGEMDKMGDTLILQNAFLKYSTDSGASWQSFAVDPPSLVQHILVNGNSIFASGYYGIYRSDDFGQTWINLSGLFLANTHFSSMLKVGNAIFATTNADLWKSTNNGNSWVSVLNTTALSKLRFYSGRMFISHGANDLMSADTGATFLPLIVPGGTGPGNYIASDSIIYAGFSTQGTHISYDLGATWVNAEVNLFDTGTVDFALIDSTVFCANKRGGVYATTLGDSAWVEKNYHLPLSQITSVSASASDVLAFTYDAGDLLRSDDKGLSWLSVISNLPPDIDIKSILNEDSVYFIATANHGLYKSSDHGLSWNAANTGLTSNNIRDIVRMGTRLFVSQATGGATFISDDEGLTWTPSSTGFQFAFADKFFVDGSRIYVKSGYNIYYSDNDGASWDSIVRAGCPAGAGPDVIGRTGNKLLALFHSNGIFMFDSTTVSWSEITNQFNNDNCNDFLIVDSTIVLAHATGIFTSDNLGATWTPTTSAAMYDICANDSIIYGGTDGGGVWRYDLFSAPSAPGYYWVGGSGNWSDFANHWATTSGGTTMHTLPPSLADDVFFDTNSGLSAFDTIYFNLTPSSCLNFNCSQGLNSLVFDGGIKVYSNLNILSSVIFNDVISLYGSSSTITTSNSLIAGIDVVAGASYSMNDDFKGEGFSSSGKLISNNHTINTPSINFWHCECYLGTSQINSETMGGAPSIKFGDSCYVENVSINFYSDPSSGARIEFHSLATMDTIIVANINVFKTQGMSASNVNFDIYIDGPSDIRRITVDDSIDVKFNMYPTFCKVGKLAIQEDLFVGNVGGGPPIVSLQIDTLFISKPGKSIMLPSGRIDINNELFSVYQLGIFSNITGGTINKSSGTICLKNYNILNNTATGGAQFFADNSINSGGNIGWQFAPCSIVSDVWPGDANYDLTVNNFDILNLGLAYNEIGPVRSGASLTYVAQPATDWNGYFQTAVNKKHADTNGDGIVDDNDTTAVSLNYGLTHPARMGNTQLAASPSDPYLYLSVNPDSANLSDTVYIETFFGTSQTPVDSVYGLAFTINYDTTLVDTSWISTQFLNSWFGQPGIDLLTFSKSIPLEQKIDVAIVRTDHNNTTGFGGPLCRTGIVIVDNVAGRMPLPITLSNARALTASEYELGINIGGDTVSVDTTTTGIVQHSDPTVAIKLFPNPAKNKLYVVTNSNSVYNYQLLDMFGNIILSNKGAVPQKTFSISSPGKGMYILQLLTSNGMVARKVVFME